MHREEKEMHNADAKMRWGIDYAVGKKSTFGQISNPESVSVSSPPTSNEPILHILSHILCFFFLKKFRPDFPYTTHVVVLALQYNILYIPELF